MQTPSLLQSVAAVGGMVAAASFAAAMVTRVGRQILPPPSDERLADFLPFEGQEADGATLLCRDGSRVSVFRVKGVDQAFLPEGRRIAFLEARKKWLDSLGDLEVSARVFTIRRQIGVPAYEAPDTPVLARIHTAWSTELSKVFVNEHYVVLSARPRKHAQRDLEQANQILMATLADYGVTQLRETRTEDGRTTPGPLTVFATLASPLSRPVPRAGGLQGEEINDLLTADEIHFTGQQGLIRVSSGDREKYCVVIGLRRPADAADEQLAGDLATIDGEVVLQHSLTPIQRPKAVAALLQQQRLALMTSFSPSVQDQFEEAIAVVHEADEDYQTIVDYAMTAFVYGDTEEEVNRVEAAIQRICRLHGAVPVRESFAAQPSWFAQFPTYDKYPRLYRLLSRAAACSVSLDRAPEGLDKSDWGPGPIAVFRTSAGSAYKWQFHVTDEREAVGHLAVIGPSGQGKTTIMAFLAGMAMRHQDLRVYFFDRHRGVEIFTHAIGGSYVTFDGQNGGASLNPFDCPDTPANRAFLRRWLKAITLCDDPVADAEVARAVTTAFDYLPPAERTLRNLHKACFSPNGTMRKELFRWVNEKQYGGIFNATQDSLDLSGRFVSFDFTSIFEDETLAPAVVSYVMHRIQSVTGQTGAPSLIVIDETAPMLKHPMFRDSFIAGLQEGRKKRQAYVCAFQQPNIVDKMGLGEVIRGQCQTVVFFRNPQATADDYTHWGLTPRELAFIQGRSHQELRHALLVSRPMVGESVILDVDLRPLGPLLKLYSSGRKSVLIAEDLRKQYGADHVDKYLETA